MDGHALLVLHVIHLFLISRYVARGNKLINRTTFPCPRIKYAVYMKVGRRGRASHSEKGFPIGLGRSTFPSTTNQPAQPRI